MKTFNLGLRLAGKTQYVLSIMESDLRKAKEEWARVTGHLDVNWDDENQTYCGWPVIQTKVKALERKANPLPFGY
jgi:hypothetical protein